MLIKKLKFTWSLIAFVLIATACSQPEVLHEAKFEEEQIDQSPVSYDRENEVIPNQYIVFLKKDSPSGLYPELAEIGAKNQNTQRKPYLEDNALGNQANDEVDIRAIGNSIVKKHGISTKGIKQVYRSIAPGFLIEMTPAEANDLKNDPDVDLVQEDRLLALELSPMTKTPFVPSEVGLFFEWEPYGIKRVGGSVNIEHNYKWNNRRVWVLDTGIDKDHPDLNIDQTYSKDFSGENNYDDGHGHGTHVAGIIGAKSNEYGISGVAAGASLVAVKVLNSQGVGTVSSLVNGLDHVKSYCLPNDVVNISLGGPVDPTIEKMMKQLSEENIHIVVAAGNSGVNAQFTSPANIEANNIYTIAAVNWWDQLTNYSNYGQVVDFAAPGDGILSTYPGGRYAYMSGTSMAAPHVAGIMMLTGGTYTESGSVNTFTGVVPIISHR